jgi:hypothetical protein
MVSSRLRNDGERGHCSTGEPEHPSQVTPDALGPWKLMASQQLPHVQTIGDVSAAVRRQWGGFVPATIRAWRPAPMTMSFSTRYRRHKRGAKVDHE